MNAPIDIILNALTGSLHWFYRSIVFDVPWSQNYFWGLTIISFVIWGLEMLFPWRKNQSFFRKDFWLDAFYMYFNFFIFTTIISGVYALRDDSRGFGRVPNQGGRAPPFKSNCERCD